MKRRRLVLSSAPLDDSSRIALSARLILVLLNHARRKNRAEKPGPKNRVK